MAYYNANKMIRLTRLAVGMTQEELCDGICSVVTLSRIETGGAVKRNTYRRLMERMGRTGGIHYAVCVSGDGGLLEEQEGMERAILAQDYGEAERCLYRMKLYADGNVLTRQYLARAEALLDYYQKRIGAKELLEQVCSVLRMTVPEYEKYVGGGKVFPFLKEELLAVMTLGIAYSSMGEGEKCFQAYETVLGCLEAEYIGLPDSRTMAVTVYMNIYREYERRGEYRKAVGVIEDCLKCSAEIDYGHAFANLLGSKAYNFIRMAEEEEKQGESEKQEIYRKDAQEYLRQAYYIAAARGDDVMAQITLEYFEKHFGKWD